MPIPYRKGQTVTLTESLNGYPKGIKVKVTKIFIKPLLFEIQFRSDPPFIVVQCHIAKE